MLARSAKQILVQLRIISIAPVAHARPTEHLGALDLRFGHGRPIHRARTTAGKQNDTAHHQGDLHRRVRRLHDGKLTIALRRLHETLVLARDG